MRCDLHAIYGALPFDFDAVDEDGDADISFNITNDLLPCPTDSISSDRLVIRKFWHKYGNSIKIDTAYFYADKETFRQLGLLIFATIFSTTIDSVRLNLTHAQSDIKSIIIDSPRERPDTRSRGYHSHPFVFHYWGDPTTACHPLYRAYDHCDINYPTFNLTNEEEFVATDEHWNGRDIIRGFGTNEGAARFAELLLNISLPATEKDQFDIEAFPGFRSVSTWSIQARLVLPGSDGWVDGGL